MILSISLFATSKIVIPDIKAQQELDYIDSVYPIKLEYPSDWYYQEVHSQLGETDRIIEIANFFPSDDDFVIIRLLIDTIPGTNDLDSYVQDTISSYKGNLHDFELLESKVFDESYQITYTFLDEEQNIMKRTEYAFFNDNFVYYVELSSPIESYEFFSNNFKDMTSSISFDSPKTKNLLYHETTSDSNKLKKSIPDAIKQEYQGKTTKLGLNLKAYENPYFGIMNIKLPTNWLTSENQTTLKISPSEDKIEQNAQILLNSYYFDGRTMEDILTDFYNRNLGFITESRPITLNSKYESHLFTLTSYYQGTNIPFDKRLVIFIASPTTSENTYYYVIEYFSSAKTFEKYLSSAISIIKSITFGNPVENANIKGFIKSSPL